jgi:hypothetical protein
MDSRRDFIKKITATAGAIALASDAGAHRSTTSKDSFNMSGYSAPRLEKVRVGVIGLGMRGSEAIRRLAYIDGLQIVAVCDKLIERAEAAVKRLEAAGLTGTLKYGGSESAWKDMCNRQDLDLIYICTPWDLHTPMAVYAMEHEKHAATEVPAATTLEECWQLVETSEKTRKHCMMLENCCYDFFELLTLNMVRNGLFGDVVHVEGAYLHDLRQLNFSKSGYVDMWRLQENIGRNGNLYPTHGLGPVCQCLDINRGDRMDYLVSLSTNDFMMRAMATELAAKDDFFKPYTDKPYRGNMNNTVVRTALGKSILIQHDVTTPRPYSRIHLVSGTKAFAVKYPEPRIAMNEKWKSPEELALLTTEYQTPLLKHVGELAKKVGGHGGMDFIMDWRLIDCLRNGLPLDQDVYDAALWSSVAPLSEKSVKQRSSSVDVPDFTRGNWKSNAKVNLTLQGGGTTGVREITAEKE